MKTGLDKLIDFINNDLEANDVDVVLSIAKILQKEERLNDEVILDDETEKNSRLIFIDTPNGFIFMNEDFESSLKKWQEDMDRKFLTGELKDNFTLVLTKAKKK